MEILSRDNLIGMVRDPKLDLYPEERRREKAEAVVENQLQKHIRVALFASNGKEGVQAFRIEFNYPDRDKARKVVESLTAQFLSHSERLQSNGDRSARMDVLEQPVAPGIPLFPNRRAIALFGGFVGMLTGSLALIIWRRMRKYAVDNIALPEDIRPFVVSRVAGGEYRDADDYIRGLIRADREHGAT